MIKRLLFCALIYPIALLAAPLYRVEYIVFSWPHSQSKQDFHPKHYFYSPKRPEHLVINQAGPLITLTPYLASLEKHHLSVLSRGSLWTSLPKNKTIHLPIYSSNPKFSGELAITKKQYLETTLTLRDQKENIQILAQKRRLKSKQLNYFDHPSLGCLLWVARPTHQSDAGTR